MKKLLVLLFLSYFLTGAAADSWISGEVVLGKAYDALEIAPEALKIRYRPAGINVDDGQQTWSTEVMSGAESNTPRVRVRLEVDGSLVQSWIVGFKRRRTVLCYVTTEDIIPGRLIKLEHLQQVERFWDGRGTPVTERETLLGRQSRRFLPVGSVVKKRDLILRPVISRGDRVVVNIQENNLSLSFEGVARRPGYPGRLLPVTTPAGKTVDVWVDYNGKVQTLGEE